MPCLITCIWTLKHKKGIFIQFSASLNHNNYITQNYDWFLIIFDIFSYFSSLFSNLKLYTKEYNTNSRTMHTTPFPIWSHSMSAQENPFQPLPEHGYSFHATESTRFHFMPINMDKIPVFVDRVPWTRLRRSHSPLDSDTITTRSNRIPHIAARCHPRLEPKEMCPHGYPQRSKDHSPWPHFRRRTRSRDTVVQMGWSIIKTILGSWVRRKSATVPTGSFMKLWSGLPMKSAQVQMA